MTRTLTQIGFWLTLAAALLGAVVVTQAATFVEETDGDFTASADFNGDGRLDLLVIDKSSGVFRLGYQDAGGSFIFGAPQPSGTSGVTGVAVGLLRSTNASFAVTGPSANAVYVVAPTGPGYAEPQRIDFVGIEPALLAAADITGGASPTSHDDLAVACMTDPTFGAQLRQLRNNATGTSLLQVQDIPDGDMRAGNRLVPQPGTPALFAHMQGTGGTVELRGWSLPGGAPGTLDLAVPGLPDGTRWLFGNFSGSSHHLVFFRPGNATIEARPITPSGPAWTTGSPLVHTFPSAVEQVIRIIHPTLGPLLVAWLENGVVESVPFDGASFGAPIPVPGLPPGQLAFGLTPVSNADGFVILSGQPGDFGPTGAQRITPTASGWATGTFSPMPNISGFEAFANVLLLDKPIFRTDDVQLRRSYRARDWSTSATIVGAGPFSTLGEVAAYGGPSQGIGAPSTQNLGNTANAPGGTLVNQQNAQFSVFSFKSRLGVAVDDVSVTPGSGTYDNAIRLTFTGLDAGTTVYFRKSGGGAFNTTTTGAGPWIYSPTGLDYYAVNAGGIASAIQHATYQFSRPPALQDSDGDGVPDFVEVAQGLDPTAGPDTDGDGFSDREEIAAGTNPNSAASKPGSHDPSPSAVTVDMGSQFQTPDGSATGQVNSGNTLTVFDSARVSRGTGVVGTGAVDPWRGRVQVNQAPMAGGFLLAGIEPAPITPLSSHPVFSTMTEIAFQIAAFPLPDLESHSPGMLTYDWLDANWQPGSTNWKIPGLSDDNMTAGTTPDLLDERWGTTGSGLWSAADWTSKYLSAPASNPLSLSVNVTPETTLIALCLEEIFHRALEARGMTSTANRLTFTDRIADRANDRVLFDSAAYFAVRTTDPSFPSAPVYRMQTVLDHLYTSAASASSPAFAFRQLARDVYAAYGQSPITDPREEEPVEALRQIVITGTVPTWYQSRLSISASGLSRALSHISAIVDNAPTRTWSNLTLFLTNNPSPIGLSLLDDTGSTTHAMINAEGAPVVLGDSFDVGPGDPILVTAFTDVPMVGGYPALEVISSTLDSLPNNVGEDTDMDLLADAYERYHFGGLHRSSYEIGDGGGYTLIQEYLDGSDPLLSASHGALPPMALELTNFTVATGTIAPQLDLSVDWPVEYAGAIEIFNSTSPDLTTFSDIPGLMVHDGFGTFDRTLIPATSPEFYKATARLKR